MGDLVFLKYSTILLFLSFSVAVTFIAGLEAHRANILAAKTVADILRTSLGPKGMDKMIVSPDGEVLITNDGATIVEFKA